MIANAGEVSNMSKLQLHSKIVEIAITQSFSFSHLILSSPSKQGYQCKASIEMSPSEQTVLKLKQIVQQLEKEKERNYILKEYFKKIEKIIYSESTSIFECEQLDYQQLQLHMREIIRRLQDVHNNRLKSAPVIYRNQNVKVYKVKPKQNN